MNASTFAKQVGLSIGGSLLVYVVLAAVFARDAALNSTGLTRGMLEQYGSLAFEEQVDLLLKNQDDERVALYMLGHICRHGERAYRVLLPFLREERSDLGRELAGQGI